MKKAFAATMILLTVAHAAVPDYTKLDEVEDHCLSTSDIPQRVSGSCINKLLEFFHDRPVWEFATMFYPVPGRMTVHGSMFSSRHHRLPFSPSDKGPTWSDVFDERVSDRSEVVASVFGDPVCGMLRDQGTIRSNLADRCEARDLFLYATQIDACMTGIDRYMYLTDGIMAGGRSRYDLVDDPTIREHYLYSIWMVGSCSSIPGVVFDDNLYKTMANVSEDTHHHEVADQLRIGYVAAMRIAARAGDPWAIGGIDISELHGMVDGRYVPDLEYLRSLHGINELLFHRWMGTSVGKNMVGGERAQLRHAVKAYALELESRPALDLHEYLRDFGIVQNELSVQALLAEVDDEGMLTLPWELDR